MNLAEFEEHYFSANAAFSLQEYVGEHVIEEQHPLIQKMIGLHEYLISMSDHMKGMENLSAKKIQGMHKIAQYRFELLDTLTDYCLEKGIAPPFEIANTAITFLDSYNRPAYLIKLHKILSFHEWMQIFVDIWTRCDGCSLYIEELREIFQDADVSALMKQYFPESTYQKWLELPDFCTGYRGAFESCKNGLSWSLDEDVALKFGNTYLNMKNKGPYYLRASCQMHDKGLELLNQKLGEKASIYAAELETRQCFLFDGREEAELFSPFMLDEDAIEDIAATAAS